MRALILTLFVLLPTVQGQEVGRLLLLSYPGTDAPLELLETLRPAGFILFPSNIGSAEELRRTTQRLRAAASYPLLLGTDQEGGVVSSYRAPGVTLFPGNMALGATGRPELAREVGAALGEELAYAGLNLDFAPVSDVASTLDNPVIGTRAFAENPETVAHFARAFAEGLEQAGVAAVAKHFPGHGATTVDSHEALPVVRHSEPQLRRLELLPFRALIEAGIPAVMSAHVVYPALDDAPATLSKPILTDLLRRDLGFRGVVMTDALNMRAITDHYGYGEAAVRSVQAGADLLLLVAAPEVQLEVYRALQEAVASGRLSRARVRQATARTARLAHRYRPSDVAKPDYAAHERLAERVAVQAATLLWNDGVLSLEDKQEVVVVAPQPKGYGEAQHLGSFFKALRGGVRSVVLSDTPTPAERAEAVAKAETADAVVLASYHGFGAFPDGLRQLAVALSALETPLIVVALGRPGDLRYLSVRPDAYAAVYGYRDANLQAAAALLLGRQPPRGRLPVRVGRFPAGSGMKGWH